MNQDECTGAYFTPSLWKQRRSFILDTLKKNKVEKVLDYGCGEGSVLSFLIPPSVTDDIHFTHLIGLDIDRNLLEQETLAACQPWPSDYEQLRESPLTVDIYCGSVGDFDVRLKNSNCDAIICSEVIEHLYPSTLNACLPLMLGEYAPPLVIVTTPNGEYNVFFADLKYGQPDATFRHNDHKFEWTRHEFEEWCTKGAQQHGYDVEFHGIGLLDGKYDQLEYGYCTQACVFKKQQPSLSGNSPPIQQHTSDSHHQLLKRFEFPYYDLPPLPVNDIFQHVESYISNLCQAATIKQYQKELQQQQQQQKQQSREQDIDINDDELNDLITWTTMDGDSQGLDWKHCGTTNNTAWCTEDVGNYSWTEELKDGASDVVDDVVNDIDIGVGVDDDDDDDSNSSQMNSNILSDDDNSDDEYRPLWTTTPITLDLETLWSILHIRQLCKTRQRLVEVVLPIGGDASYKVMGDQLVVHKSFMVKN